MYDIFKKSVKIYTLVGINYENDSRDGLRARHGAGGGRS